MNIFKKIFGIRYRVGDKFFLSEEEATKCADQENETCETEWFKHDKETYDDIFKAQEEQRIARDGFVNHRDR